jgi:hypothetical protein
MPLIYTIPLRGKVKSKLRNTDTLMITQLVNGAELDHMHPSYFPESLIPPRTLSLYQNSSFTVSTFYRYFPSVLISGLLFPSPLRIFLLWPLDLEPNCV